MSGSKSLKNEEEKSEATDLLVTVLVSFVLEIGL
jgi:hypothetical protein